MSSTLSTDGPKSEPQARGRHAAPRAKRRLTPLGAVPGTIRSLARTFAGPAGLPVPHVAHVAVQGPAPSESGVAAASPDRLAGAIRVVVGPDETVADIAAAHGVSTAAVLALNGLGWRTPVREGDELLVRPAARAADPVAPVGVHVVREGETLDDLAARHGVAVAALLLANGLSRGAALRAGSELVVPAPKRRASGPVVLAGDMRANAAGIVAAGRLLGAPDDAVVVALAAAMQDSCLHNLDFGEDDAVGVLQLRPSDGWGTEAELLDPRKAATAFLRGPRFPGGGTRGLLELPGWEFLAVGEVATAVLLRGTATGYGRWERSARSWLEDLDRGR
ncbi:LysM peptidoglycan-binding domain-containing protein [Amnibacterium sp. CER49]|uniref:LysM peptidoglycan-binding domain-containing protein n=1 Tax=Amnibacterium sp. CER49 TaxID=3039161 RepID=UPI00244C9BB7|nr:LysM domain-containing protein [Amnibacterium sp. CER49]MDH2444717.1 LysM peptidoglycan-binding domain-containing protein [Amnibacterium sp. CER49]